MGNFRTYPTKEIYLLKDSGNNVHKSFTFKFYDVEGEDISDEVTLTECKSDDPNKDYTDIIDVVGRTVSIASAGEFGKVLVRASHGDYQDIIEVTVCGTISNLVLAHESFTLIRGLGERLVALFAVFQNNVGGSIVEEKGFVTANSHLVSFSTNHATDIEIDNDGIGKVKCENFDATRTYDISVSGAYDSYDDPTTSSEDESLSPYEPSLSLDVSVIDFDHVDPLKVHEIPNPLQDGDDVLGDEDVRFRVLFAPVGFSANDDREKFEKISRELVRHMIRNRFLSLALDKVKFYYLSFYSTESGVNVSPDLNSVTSNSCQYTVNLRGLSEQEAAFMRNTNDALGKTRSQIFKEIFLKFGNYKVYKETAIETEINSIFSYQNDREACLSMMKRTEVNKHQKVHDSVYGYVVGSERRNFSWSRAKNGNQDVDWYGPVTDMGLTHVVSKDDLFFYHQSDGERSKVEDLILGHLELNEEPVDWLGQIDASLGLLVFYVYNYDNFIGVHAVADGIRNTSHISIGTKLMLSGQETSSNHLLGIGPEGNSARIKSLKVLNGTIHEFLHAFNVGDEYENDTGEEEMNEFTGLDLEHGNLQGRRSLFKNKQFNPAELKWNWSKMALAAMITGSITYIDDQLHEWYGHFRCPIEPDQITNWATNVGTVADVILRSRAPMLVKDKYTFSEYGTSPKEQLKIVEVDKPSNSLILEDVGGNFIKLIDENGEAKRFGSGDVVYSPAILNVLEGIFVNDGGLLKNIKAGKSTVEVKTLNRSQKQAKVSFAINELDSGYEVSSVLWPQNFELDNFIGVPQLDWSKYLAGGGHAPSLTYQYSPQFVGLKAINLYRPGVGYSNSVDLTFSVGEEIKEFKKVPAQVSTLVDNEDLKLVFPSVLPKVIMPPRITFKLDDKNGESRDDIKEYSFWIKGVGTNKEVIDVVAFNIDVNGKDVWRQPNDDGKPLGALNDPNGYSVTVEVDDLIGTDPHSQSAPSSPVSFDVEFFYDDIVVSRMDRHYPELGSLTPSLQNAGAGYHLPRRPIVFYNAIINCYLFGYLDSDPGPGKVIRFEIVSRGPVADGVSSEQKYFVHPFNLFGSWKGTENLPTYEGLEDYSFQSDVDGMSSNGFLRTDDFNYNMVSDRDNLVLDNLTRNPEEMKQVAVQVMVTLEEIEVEVDKDTVVKKKFVDTVKIINSPSTYEYPTTGPLLMYSGTFGWDGNVKPPFFIPMIRKVSAGNGSSYAELYDAYLLDEKANRVDDTQSGGFIRLVGTRNTVDVPNASLQIGSDIIQDLDSFHSKDYFDNIEAHDPSDPMYQNRIDVSIDKEGLVKIDIQSILDQENDASKWLKELKNRPDVVIRDSVNPKNKTAEATCSMRFDETLLNPVVLDYIIKTNRIFNQGKPKTSPQTSALAISRFGDVLEDIKKFANEKGLSLDISKRQIEELTLLYEGGGLYNKGVIRTSIDSIMRNHGSSSHLNYVSLYQLLNMLNPSAIVTAQERFDVRFRGKTTLKK